MNLLSWDAFPKTLEDFRIRTKSGATLSLLTVGLCVVLVLAELQYYTVPNRVTTLSIDTTPTDIPLSVHLALFFPSLPCAAVGVDVIDALGGAQINVQRGLLRQRIDRATGEVMKAAHPRAEALVEPATNTTCGSCYGAETADLRCCNSCDDVKRAYRARGWGLSTLSEVPQCITTLPDDEGCRIYGTLQVPRVAGNFHVAPGHAFQGPGGSAVHLHDTSLLASSKLNTSHAWQTLAFGKLDMDVPNPLDGVVKVNAGTSPASYQYYVKIVPTRTITLDGVESDSCEYSVTTLEKPVEPGSSEGALPGVFVSYDLSPIMITYADEAKSLGQLATSVCAIVGGVFTLASLIDRFVYASLKSMEAKVELGKYA